MLQSLMLLVCDATICNVTICNATGYNVGKVDARRTQAIIAVLHVDIKCTWHTVKAAAVTVSQAQAITDGTVLTFLVYHLHCFTISIRYSKKKSIILSPSPFANAYISI